MEYKQSTIQHPMIKGKPQRTSSHFTLRDVMMVGGDMRAGEFDYAIADPRYTFSCVDSSSLKLLSQRSIATEDEYYMNACKTTRVSYTKNGTTVIFYPESNPIRHRIIMYLLADNISKKNKPASPRVYFFL